MPGVISERQKAVYDYCKKFIEEKGHSPLISDISKHFGFSSNATTHRYLLHLEAAGWIKRGKRGARVQLIKEFTLVEQINKLKQRLDLSYKLEEYYRIDTGTWFGLLTHVPEAVLKAFYKYNIDKKE